MLTATLYILCNVMILMMSGFVMFDIIFIFTGILLLSHQHDNWSFIDFLEKHLLSCIFKYVDPIFKLCTTPSYGFDHLRTVLEKRLDSSSPSTASCSTGKTNCHFYSDRKSTRLNSSHQIISYAVFCLKKKNKTLKLRQLRPYLHIVQRHTDILSSHVTTTWPSQPHL